MTKRLLVDSDVVIEYLRKSEKAVEFLNSVEPAISDITVGEVFQGSRDKTDLRNAKEFFGKTTVIPVTSAISKKAVQLVERYTLSHGLLILDALIAATAIQQNLILVTGNYKHFQMIKGLRLERYPA